MSTDDTDDLSLLALFAAEVETYAAVLTEGLVALEAGANGGKAVEPLMRAAHSIKGAARIVGLDAAVRVAHAMEDALVAAQDGRLSLSPARVDLLLRGVDWIVGLSHVTEDALPGWLVAHADEGEDLERRLAAIGELPEAETPVAQRAPAAPPVPLAARARRPRA